MPEMLAEINVIVLTKNNAPAIELRMSTNNIDLMKKVISCVFHQQPIIVMPVFNDKLKSIAALLEKGILYIKDGEYYFNI